MSWIDRVLQRYNLGEEYQRQRVLFLWEKAVGCQTAKVSRAERFSQGTLWVSVASSTIAQELSFLEARYIERINNLLGEEALLKICFVPGRFKKEMVKEDVTLSDTEREDASKLFSALDDCQLRESFERLYLTTRRREAVILQAGGKRCSRCGVAFSGAEEICPGCRFGEIEPEKRTD